MVTAETNKTTTGSVSSSQWGWHNSMIRQYMLRKLSEAYHTRLP